MNDGGRGAVPEVVDGFGVAESSGDAHEFHHRPLEFDEAPAVWIHRVARPAIVLGSTQRDDVVDRAGAEADGFEVTGRRSGGGIVLVDPAESCWIDVVVPRGHERWDDDVTRAFHWVGERWCAALAELGLPGTSVHRGRGERSEWGRAVCFAGLGPGEVTMRTSPGAIERKVVGLSQRRTRDVARIQGLYLARWDPLPMRRHVRAEALPADLDLDAVAAGVDPGVPAPDPTDVVTAFLEAMSSTD